MCGRGARYSHGLSAGLAAIHLRLEIRVDEKPFREPHGQPSRAGRSVVIVNRAQQTDVGGAGRDGWGKEIEVKKRPVGGIDADAQTEGQFAAQEKNDATRRSASCQTGFAVEMVGKTVTVRSTRERRFGEAGLDVGSQVNGRGPRSEVADVQTGTEAMTVKNRGQQTNAERNAEESYEDQVGALAKFAGAEGGKDVTLAALTLNGAGPFTLRAVVLREISIWEHTHVSERRLAVPVGGDMKGWRHLEVGRFVVPQQGDARSVRLEFNLDGKNLSGGFHGLSGAVSMPAVREGFRQLVERDIAAALDVPRERIRCGIPYPCSPLLCDLDILHGERPGEDAADGGPMALVRKLQSLVNDRTSSLVRNVANIGSKLRRATLFPWREGHARSRVSRGHQSYTPTPKPWTPCPKFLRPEPGYMPPVGPSSLISREA